MKQVILNGESVGRTICKSCAFRYVRILLWKRGYRGSAIAGELRASRKVTDKTIEFTYELKDSELPIHSTS